MINIHISGDDLVPFISWLFHDEVTSVTFDIWNGRWTKNINPDLGASRSREISPKTAAILLRKQLEHTNKVTRVVTEPVEVLRENFKTARENM